MTTATRITTAEQLLDAGDIGRCELIRGELVMMSPAGDQHGRVGFRLALLLGAYVEAHALGLVHAAETGFVLARNPDTVRAPDLAFTQAARVLPAPTHGYCEVIPDLVAEVLSPDDRAGEVLSKTQEWLAAGCRAVWLVDPNRKTVAVHRGDHPVRVFRAGDTLTGDDVVSGFAVAVADIFRAPVG